MMRRVLIFLTASALAGAVLFCPAFAKSPARSLVLLEDAEVTGPDGAVLGRTKAYDCFSLAGERPAHWLVRYPQEGPQGSRGLIAKPAGASVPGAPEAHRRRLGRLKKASLSSKLARRLARGRIQVDDTFYLVELAWGEPQRHFMVNYFSDEMHYVYFRPDGTTVLLKFKSGRLAHKPEPRPSLR